LEPYEEMFPRKGSLFSYSISLWWLCHFALAAVLRWCEPSDKVTKLAKCFKSPFYQWLGTNALSYTSLWSRK
jgi:hypothetical protein